MTLTALTPSPLQTGVVLPPTSGGGALPSAFLKVSPAGAIAEPQFAQLPQDALTTQKLSKAYNEALALFTAYRTTPDLLRVARELGVTVYDGNEQPWVDALCRERGVEGFVFTPHSRRYPGQKSPGESLPASTSPATPFDTVVTELEKGRQQGLFVKRGASPDVVMHELFHVLQERNGLPFGVNPEADAAADTINNHLNRVSPRVVAQRLGLWALATAGQFLGPQKEPTTPVALSLHRQMQREAEADKFFIAHGEGLGLSELQRLKHVLHYVSETRFKLSLSQLLDKDQTLLAKLEKLV